MNFFAVKFLSSIIVLGFADSTELGNETVSEDRNPRVSGRIVKLYSGPKPEPIYCADEGFQQDPVNCAIFYRCVKSKAGKYTVFRFQCGPGTIYDPDTEVCNHPRSTKRTECLDNLDFTQSTEKNNDNEIPKEWYRPEVPSPISIKPIYHDDTLKEAASISTMYPWATTTTTKNVAQSTSNQWVTANKQQTLAPTSPGKDRCVSDGFMGDSKNCRKFYRCVGNQRGGYIRYEFTCSENTVWDEDSQSCNHPWAVQRSRCGRSNFEANKLSPYTSQSPNRDDSPVSSIQQQLQVNYGSKVTQMQTQISHASVIQNQTQINYGNKNQNSEAIQNQTQISYGTAVSQSQTQINHADKGVQTQLQIDHSNEASQVQVQVYETSSNNPTTLENESNGYNTPSQSQQTSNNKDGNKCRESGFRGDSEDCKKFYRCVDNGRGGFTKYEFTCGEGTVWDSDIEACNHAWAVKTCGENSPAHTTVESATTSNPTTTTQNYYTTQQTSTVSEEEDTGYGNQNQNPSHTPTPKPGTDVNGQNESETTTAVIIQSPNAENNECKSSGFIGDSYNCKKFYRCVDNGNGRYTRYEFSCGEGTVWDPQIEACNHAWAVEKCGVTDSANFNKEPSSSSQLPLSEEYTDVTHTEKEPAEEDQGYNNGRPNPQETTAFNSEGTTTSTTEKIAPGNDICMQEGFMGDSKNCKKFYRCVSNGRGGFIRYEFSCGEGTAWDSEINACNHEKSVKTPCSSSSSSQTETQTTTPLTPQETVSSPDTIETTEASKTTAKPVLQNQCSQEGFVGDHNDCKKFYRCVDNGRGGFIKYEFTCGEGTVWDSELNTCNHPSSNNRCGGSSESSNSESLQQEPDRENDEPVTESNTSSSMAITEQMDSVTQSTLTQTTQITSGECKSEGFFGNPNDCKKFYRCVDNGKGNYIKYDFTCGEGTVWDQEIQGCNHDNGNKKCLISDQSQSNKPAPETPKDQDATTSLNAETQPSTEKVESSLQISSGMCNAEGFYANPDDCKKFFRCVDNGKGSFTKYDFSCGEGTIWVQEILACDHDNDLSTCNTSISSTSATSQSTEPAFTTIANQTGQPDTENDESLTQSPSNGENCTSEGFYPNKNDCKKFYRCVDNGNGRYTRYDFTCGEGTAWDSDIQSCNHISEVESCQNDTEYKPVMQDEESSQPTTTTSMDSTTNSSTSGPSTQSSKPVTKDHCDQEGYYGNTQDCTKFYRCVDNDKGGYTKYDFSCGEGTIWDQDITACNHPQDVSNPSCKQSDSNNNMSSSTASSSSSSTEQSTTTATNNGSSDCSHEDSSKKPTNKDVNCTEAGYFADPNDCKKFYRCVDWDGDGKRFSVYHFECGEGTIWDPALDTCNHEDSVYPPRDCSGSQQSETATEESTTAQEQSTTSTTQEQTTVQEETTTTETTTTTTQQTTEKQNTTEDLNQQTTTQQSTTSQQTTEKTTELGTIEQTTSQQTTQEHTTQETTQQTTEEQTTTQKSTTTEQTTTQQSTTEQTTQESSTNEQQGTTEQSTESTSQQSTTKEQESQTESTTQQSTTEQDKQTEETESTTQQSTTEQDKQTEETEGTTQQSTTENQQNQTEESTTDQSTTESSESESSTTESISTTESSSSSEKECPNTDDDQNVFVCPTSFRRHPKYCNLFYQCTEDDDTHDAKIATFHCPNNTIYDESQVKCVEEEKAEKKCKGEIAQRRRLKRLDTTYKEPITITNERLKCPTAGHFPFEKNGCSPAFLKCQKTKSGKVRGYVYQCPEGFVYWSVSRRCESKEIVKDCKRSFNNWSGRWEIPIEKRNVAP